MKPVNLEAFRKNINEIGGCNVEEAYAAGWNAAIEAVKSVLDDMIYKPHSSYEVGDQIEVYLNGYGVFTATVQKVTNKYAVFMFDKCVYRRPMDDLSPLACRYEESSLWLWINNALRPAFPKKLKQRLIDISIPTYGQIFGHDEELYAAVFEPDDDEQFKLMKKKKNRIACYKDDAEWFWLQNATNKALSAKSVFALVSCHGHPGCASATTPLGVRPVFTLSI